MELAILVWSALIDCVDNILLCDLSVVAADPPVD